MMHSMGLTEQVTRSEKYYLFAHQRLLQLCRELDELPYESEEDCVSNDQVGEKDCEMNQIENYKNYIQASALAASSAAAKISSGWIGCLFLQFAGKSNNRVHSSNDHSRYNFSGKSNKC
ncbi:hypothetical protein P3S68_020228 [Capsicum galapagoense]